MNKTVLAAIIASMYSGGTVPSSPTSMALGINLGWVSDWSGTIPFANVMYNCVQPVRLSGSGTYTHNQGVIVATNQTDEFQFKCQESSGLPSGTYTVLNPDGCTVGAGPWGAPTYTGGYRTETSFTFEFTAGEFLCVQVKGSLSRLVVLLPGTAASWAAGNIWNPAFLTYQQGLGAQVLRTMDWTNASANIETHWSNRTLPDKVTIYNTAGFGPVVPYEFICDLANRLGKDPWVCVPVRATTDYVTQMATLFKNNLDAGRKPWFELGNEIWNESVPWIDGTQHMNYLKYTKHVATADYANNRYYLPGHGMATGDDIVCFTSLENRAANAARDWQVDLGIDGKVEVIDANHFYHISTDLGTLGQRVNVGAAQVNLLFVRKSEFGGIKDMDGNYGELSLRNWGIITGVMGAGTYKRLIGSFINGISRTAPRLAASGGADYLAVAPYFYGNWWGCELDVTSTTITPRVWCNNSRQIHVAVYPATATPIMQDIVLGTGAVSKQLIDFAYTSDPMHFVTGAAFTGLTNNTDYKVFAVLVDGNGYSWQTSTTVSTATTPATAPLMDSFANQRLRNLIDAERAALMLDYHKSAAGSVPVICYEGGLHFHEAGPASVRSWLKTYQESAEFADTVGRDLHMIADIGAKAFCYYGDVLGTSFSLSDTYNDTADLRYQKYASFGGSVTAGTQLALPNLVIGDVASAPAYPGVIHTFADAGLTYQVVNGDKFGNYEIVGNQLRMKNGNGVDFGVPKAVNLVLLAYSATSCTKFTVSFATGNAWYVADAKYAWSSIDDTDTAALNPAIGDVVPLTSGSPATVSGGMWSLAGAIYSRAALPSPYADRIDATKPWLVAAVLDKSTDTSAYSAVASVGSLLFAINSPGTPLAAAKWFGQAVDGSCAAATPAGKHVFWAMYDGARYHSGYDQAVYRDYPLVLGAGSFLDGEITLGSATSGFKYGSQQIVSRVGMTISDALSIVAKMQAHHGIA